MLVMFPGYFTDLLARSEYNGIQYLTGIKKMYKTCYKNIVFICLCFFVCLTHCICLTSQAPVNLEISFPWNYISNKIFTINIIPINKHHLRNLLHERVYLLKSFPLTFRIISIFHDAFNISIGDYIKPMPLILDNIATVPLKYQ